MRHSLKPEKVCGYLACGYAALLFAPMFGSMLYLHKPIWGPRCQKMDMCVWWRVPSVCCLLRWQGVRSIILFWKWVSVIVRSRWSRLSFSSPRKLLSLNRCFLNRQPVSQDQRGRKPTFSRVFSHRKGQHDWLRLGLFAWIVLQFVYDSVLHWIYSKELFTEPNATPTLINLEPW